MNRPVEHLTPPGASSAPPASIPRFEAIHAPEAIAEAVATEGVAVVDALVDGALVDAVTRELSPYLDAVAFCEGHFMGRHTKRTSRLVAKSPSSRRLIAHPLVLEVVDRLLGPHCYNYQLHSTLAIRIHPGETAQSLHRDDNVFPLRHPCAPTAINVLWALEPFTADNGATRVVVGSHHWDDERRPREQDATTTLMSPGSVVVFDSATYHGGGANVGTSTRSSVLFSYSLGWLRQLENQFLAVPPAIARTLDPSLRALVGYRTHGYLGSFEMRSPEEALADEIPAVLTPQDLYTPELQARRLPRR